MFQSICEILFFFLVFFLDPQLKPSRTKYEIRERTVCSFQWLSFLASDGFLWIRLTSLPIWTYFLFGVGNFIISYSSFVMSWQWVPHATILFFMDATMKLLTKNLLDSYQVITKCYRLGQANLQFSLCKI